MAIERLLQVNINAARLSPRQKDVVRLISLGMTNRQIAASLGLKLQTVKNYIKNIMWRMGVETRTAILAKLIGLLPAEAK